MPYATQQGLPQQMYYTTPGGQAIYQAGGQSYVFAQPGITTTGAPAIYSAGPALHNGATQQQSASSQSQQQQPSVTYQLAAANGQAASAGVVAQQPAQLIQRSSVLSQVRHHPYRN